MSLYRPIRNLSFHKGDNSHRTVNTCTSKNSAYDRIFSSKNIITGTLPLFLSEFKLKEGISQEELLRFDITLKIKPERSAQATDITESSPCSKMNESPNNRSKRNSDRLQDINIIKQTIDDIFNPTLPIDEEILKFNKRKLTRGDLLCFREGDLPECVVDCYMSILKVANKIAIKQTPNERIIVVNAMYSKQLFKIRREIPMSKTNIFDYDIMLFPIFDGY